MKTNLILVAVILIAAIAHGQNQELREIEVTPPAFKSDFSKSINDFLQKKMEYPFESYLWKIQGTEIVQFVVTAEGKLTGFKIINSISTEIDQEVIRTLKSTSGKWIPGTKNGEPVDMEQEVSMAFKIYPTDNFVEMAIWNYQKGNEFLFVKNNPKKALTFYNKAINFLPTEESLHAVRGFCKYRMGDENGADRDLEMANLLADRKGIKVDFKNLALNSDKLEDFEQLLLSFKK
jgi:TonB family protein